MSEIVLGAIYLFTAPPRVVMKEKELFQTLLELDVVPTGTFYLGLEGKMFLNKDYQKYVERWFQNKEIKQSCFSLTDLEILSHGRNGWRRPRIPEIVIIPLLWVLHRIYLRKLFHNNFFICRFHGLRIFIDRVSMTPYSWDEFRIVSDLV